MTTKTPSSHEAHPTQTTPIIGSVLRLIHAHGLEPTESRIGLTLRILDSHVRQSQRRRRRKSPETRRRMLFKNNPKAEKLYQSLTIQKGSDFCEEFLALLQALQDTNNSNAVRKKSVKVVKEGVEVDENTIRIINDFSAGRYNIIDKDNIHRRLPTNAVDDANSSETRPLHRTKEKPNPSLISSSADNNINTAAKANMPLSTIQKSSAQSYILRELLYSLQCGGLPSVDNATPLPSSLCDDYVYRSGCNVNMVHRIAYVAHLVYSLESRIKSLSDNNIKSVALRSQLQDFYRLVAALEAKRNTNDLTLRQLCLNLRAPTLKLKLLCTIADAATDIHLSLPLFARHASPIHREAVEQIEAVTTGPIWKQVKDWVYFGKMSPEFFIGVNPEANSWVDRYYVKYDKVPSFLCEDGIPELLLCAGRERNFINLYLNISYIPPDELSTLQSDPRSKLEALSLHANKFIVESLLNQHELFANMYTLKQFFLMQKGDFWSIFINSVGMSLNLPASSLKKFELEASMVSAAAQRPNELFDRVHVRLLSNDLPASESLKGWDVFSLDYAVDTALSVVLSSNHLRKYQKVFAFLFFVHQIDWKLSQLWQKQIQLEHLLLQLSLAHGQLRYASLVRQKMLHFVRNLQNYLQCEVLDSAWKVFMRNMSAALNLTDIISAHDLYLSSLLPKGLEKLIPLFTLVAKFCAMCYEEFKLLFENLKEIKRVRTVAESRVARGEWGMDINENEVPLRQLQTQAMKLICANFEDILSTTCSVHMDNSDLRSLSFRLRFNGYYS